MSWDARLLLPSAVCFIILSALATLVSCSRSDTSEPSEAPAWRMFDDLSNVQLESDLRSAESIDEFLANSESLVDAELTSWLEQRGATLTDPAIDAILFENVETRGNPQVAYGVIPSGSRRMHWLLVDLMRSLAPDETIFCIELPAAQAIEFQSDPKWLLDMLRKYTSLIRHARPELRFGAEQRVGLQFEPTRPAIQLLIGVVTRGEALGRSRLRVSRLDRVRGWQLATHQPSGGGRSLVRRVELGAVTRPCLALGSSGRVRADIAVGPREPRLSFTVGMLWQDAPTRVRIQGTVRGERTTVAIDRVLELAPRRFEPFEHSLAEVADQRVHLDLEFLATERREEAILLLSEPVIEGLAEPANARPDVIVISLDTTRADRLSLYGAKRPTTPNLDAFAKSAVVFETAISAASWTLPSHTTMFSGEYPDRHGVFGMSSLLLDDTPWLPEMLRTSGYQTVAFTGGGYLEPAFGHSRGYDRYGTIDVDYPQRSWAEKMQDARQIEAARRSEAERRELLALVGEPRRRPLFLFVHTYGVHNYAPSLAALTSIGVAPEELDEHVRIVDRKIVSREFRSQKTDETQRRAMRERIDTIYDATLHDADRMVGELLDALERSGRLEHAIVIVLSDHGEEIFERGDIGHGQSVYEEQIRVPFIVKAPGIAPARLRELISLADLTPTLLELLGLPALHERADGRSIVPLLRGGSLAPVPVLSRGDRRGTVFRSLRGAVQKVIENKPVGTVGTYELYDLPDDPGETRNLAIERAQDRERLATILTGTVRSLENSRRRTGSLDLSNELQAELRELGYLGGDR